jgi:hypothetical protein
MADVFTVLAADHAEVKAKMIRNGPWRYGLARRQRGPCVLGGHRVPRWWVGSAAWRWRR